MFLVEEILFSLTLEDLKNEIPNIDKDSINTRILRDDGKIFQTEGSRPKKISVKPNLPEVILYLNSYKCRVCMEVKPIEFFNYVIKCKIGPPKISQLYYSVF